ncbi:MAG: hypothetical protein JOZ63_06350, partial [Planctomycetaceae bacterium]|nr:hypothetical protein [Planctomycetaceae bacterium]
APGRSTPPALTFATASAVPRTVEAHRLARLVRAQQEWAELMDRRW